jgi:glucose-1-phosphate cytidylyltransferase
MEIKSGIPVVILCGGKGERLYPLTIDIPKPLIEINGEPILWYIIEHLKKYQTRKFIITVGYKAEKIEEYFDKNHKNLNIQIVNSGDADIIKRIQDAAKYISTDFLVLYGDTLSNVNIDKLIKYHSTNTQNVTMTVWPLVSQFGLVEISKEGKVTSFNEKPKLPQWINIGYFYFNKNTFNIYNEFDRFQDFLHFIAEKGDLNAYCHQGIHFTVNTIKELEEAEKQINQIF